MDVCIIRNKHGNVGTKSWLILRIFKQKRFWDAEYRLRLSREQIIQGWKTHFLRYMIWITVWMIYASPYSVLFCGLLHFFIFASLLCVPVQFLAFFNSHCLSPCRGGIQELILANKVVMHSTLMSSSVCLLAWLSNVHYDWRIIAIFFALD